MSGLTPTGFVAKTVQEILSDLQNAQRSTVDGSLNPTATGVLANLNASFALQLGQLWELGQEIYDAHDPNSAEGIAADHNGALSGITRLDHSKSTVVLSLTLAANTTVNAGAVVSVAGNPSARFVTLEDAMSLGTPTSIDVRAEAEDYGPIVVGADALWVIESPTSGWTSVTNADAAVTGADVETNETYRARRVREVASQGGSTTSGVIASLRKLTSVLEADAIENDTDAAVDGIPRHSFECIVLSDPSADPDDTTIATTIWANKPAGIDPWGSTSVDIVDSEGVTQTVGFTRPTPVPINVNYEADVDATYLAHGVKDAISDATANPADAAHFGVGKDVYLVRLNAAGLKATGVINLTLDFRRDPDVPSFATPGAPNEVIAIGPREIATFTGATWTELP